MALIPGTSTLFVAAETTYRDGTLDGIDGADAIRAEGVEVTWTPLAAEDKAVAGGLQFAPDVPAGASLGLKFMLALLPVLVSAALTERPHGHAAIQASGATLVTLDDAEVTGASLGLTGSGTGPFSLTIPGPVWRGSVQIYLDGASAMDESFADNGLGGLTGTASGTGTVNYTTGAVSLTFGAAPGAGRAILVDYVRAQTFAPMASGLTGNGSHTTFNLTLPYVPVAAGTVSVTDGVETFSDDGAGNLTGSGGGSGTVNYTTGAVSVTFNAAPANLAPIQVGWRARRPGPYRLRYEWRAHDHQSAAVLVQHRDSRTLGPSVYGVQYSGKGARFVATLQAQTQNLVKLAFDGQAVDAVMEPLASSDLVAVDPFPAGLPGVHTVAQVSMVARFDQRGTSSNVTFAGTAQNLEARPGYTVERGESATDSSGADEVLLVPPDKGQQVDIETVFKDLDTWALHSICSQAVPVDLLVTWRDVIDARNSVRLTAVVAPVSEGLTVNANRNGRASATLKTKVLSGLPLAIQPPDVPQPPPGTDPAGEMLALEWVTTPTAVTPTFNGSSAP